MISSLARNLLYMKYRTEERDISSREEIRHIEFARAMYTIYTSKSHKAHDISSQVYISYCRATFIRNCSIAYYINHVALHVLYVNRYRVTNRIYIFVYMYMCVCIHMYIYVYIYIHIYICIYVYIYIYICVCVCVYTYIHTYIHTHIYIYIYLC